MVSYYRAFAPKSEAVNCWDNRATLSEYEVIDCYYTLKTCLMLGEEIEESGKPAVTGN